LRSLERNGHIWYKHINDKFQIEYQNNNWIIKNDNSLIAYTENSNELNPMRAKNWKHIVTHSTPPRESEKAIDIQMQTLSYEDIDCIEDKAILQCLDRGSQKQVSDDYYLLMVESAKIASYWKLVLHRIRDCIPISVRYNLVHIPLANARKDELDEKINNLEKNPSSSSSLSSVSNENIIFTLMCPDEKTVKKTFRM